MPSHDVDIVEMSIEGDGIARIGSRNVRVPFTIPGERVRIEIAGSARTDDSRHPGHIRRRDPASSDVLEASPHRVTPRCRHFGECGGCSWQHIAYPEQLRLKTEIVDRLVRASVPSAPRAQPMVSANADSPWGFRQKVHFLFGEGAGRPGSRRLLVGHRARGSRRVIAVTECPVHDPRGNAIAFQTHAHLAQAHIQAASSTGEGAVRSIVVRTALNSPEAMTTLVVAHEGDKRLRAATRKAIGESPEGTSFSLNVHDRNDGFIFGRKTRTLAGRERLKETVGGVAHLISPTAFFQTNVAAAELLVAHVLEQMPRTPARIVDLYAGAGLFAIALARAGHVVTAIESSREAVADGRASLRLNGLEESRCRFIASRTESALASVGATDVAVFDPPREGCGQGVIATLFGRLRPALAVYVSCNPVMLATDLREITGHGYTVRSLLPVDMFPHTPHIETVAVLTR